MEKFATKFSLAQSYDRKISLDDYRTGRFDGKLFSVDAFASLIEVGVAKSLNRYSPASVDAPE
jgi:hypothetical protein